MPNSHRIRTQLGVDKVLQINLDQDYDTLELLSFSFFPNDVIGTRRAPSQSVLTLSCNSRDKVVWQLGRYSPNHHSTKVDFQQKWFIR